MDDLRWQGHLTRIVEAIVRGRLVSFLGADINLCDRPKGADGKDLEWTEEAPFPPSNQELALYLDGKSEGLGPTYRQEVRCPFAETQQLDQLPQECPLRRGGVALKLPIKTSPNTSLLMRMAMWLSMRRCESSSRNLMPQI